MKHSNLVEGQKVQAKHTHHDRTRPQLELAEGAVFTVEYVFNNPNTGFRLSGATLHGEDGYGNAENFRKYVEVVDVPTVYKVGDTVLVGAEGAGSGWVLPEYAGKVCTITKVDMYSHRELVEISHPDVMDGESYTSKVEYLTPHKVEELVVVFAEGDIVELDIDTVSKHDEAIPSGLYKVLGKSGYRDCIRIVTKHGECDEATVLTALLTKVGVCTSLNG